MITINNHLISESVYDILQELKRQLYINGTQRFAKFTETKNNIQTNCPFHNNGQERKPSFGINKNTGECHCFACGWHGDLSGMISNCFGKDDLGSFGNKWLLKNFVSVEVEKREGVDLDLALSRTTDTLRHKHYGMGNSQRVTEKELDSYRCYHPYMWKRKLTPEIVELFDIGYDEKTNCLTFPNRDIHGNVLFVARRSVKTKYFNYPSDVEKPIYGLYELNQYWQMQPDMKPLDEVIICESMLDALTAWVYGKHAVALNGLGSESQFKILRNMYVRKVILATDNDYRGMKARERLKKELYNKIVTEYIFPEGKKDLNELSKEEFDSLEEIFN